MNRIENPSLEWRNETVPASVVFDDIYFNRANGLAETTMVFIEANGLPQRWIGERQFTIAETGFGTGLNFLATWKLFEHTANDGERLDFISVERYPLTLDDLRRTLEPWRSEIGDAYIDRLLACYPMRIPGFHRRWITPHVTLTLIFDDALRAFKQLDCPVDAWFLDGFTPIRNPQMWEEELFTEMARLSHSGTSFASFTAAAAVRKGLKQAGFTVQRKDGFGYKYHRIIGAFPNGTPKEAFIPPKQVTIVGAGLAGAAMSHALKRRGVECRIIDRDGIANGASGNKLGLVNPKIEAQDNARTDLGLSAFSFATATLKDIPNIELQQNGALHLATDSEKTNKLQKILSQGGWLDPHLQWVKQADTNDICGIALACDGLFYKDAVSVNTNKLVHALLDNVTKAEWDSKTDQPVILCTGWGLKELQPHLPLQPVRGQVVYATAPVKLKCPIMFGQYCAPVDDASWAMGATFEQNNAEAIVKDEDTYKITQAVTDATGIDGFTITSSWAQVRTATRDRYPVAGQAGENLYVLGALGSHGIQFALLLAEIIACQLTNAPLPVGRDALKTVDINRFGKVR